LEIVFPATGEKVTCSLKTIKGNNMARCHTHKSYELYFLLEGERYLFVGNRFYKLSEGDAAIIAPGIKHRTLEVRRSEYKRLTANIPAECIPAVPELREGVLIATPKGAELSSLLSEVEAYESAEGGGRDAILAYSAVLRIFSDVLRLAPSAPVAVSSTRLDRVSDVFEYLDGHYTEGVTLSYLAERFYFSEYHLSRLFKEYTGKNFTAHLNDLRISRAEQLLAGGESVARVALLAGFGSVSAFCAAFRKRNGIPPSAYKKVIGKSEK